MKKQALKNRTIETVFAALDGAFAGTEKPGTVAMDAADILAAIRAKKDNIDKVREGLITRYALKDNEGNFVPVYMGEIGGRQIVVPPSHPTGVVQKGSKQVDPAKLDEYNTELNAVLDMETEISTPVFDRAEIRKLVNVRPDVLEVLRPFISE